MIDEVAGSTVREVPPDPAEADPAGPWAPAAARAGTAAGATIPDDDDAEEPPAEHPAASRQAPASSALKAAARDSKDDVMPLGRARSLTRFRARGHRFATYVSRAGAGCPAPGPEGERGGREQQHGQE